MQARAAEDLKRLMGEGLKKAGLEFENARTFVTPRRLVFVADGIPENTPDISEERKGPATDAPEQALNGFLGATGLMLDQCEKREIKGREFYFAIIEKTGSSAGDILPGIIDTALNALPWAKSMKWGRHDLRWVRPLHGLLCVFGGQLLSMDFGPMSSTDTTPGHRFMAPGAITVAGFGEYKAKLHATKVMIDAAERRELIVTNAAALAAAEGLSLKDDKGLLDEVTGLVEWPVVLMGRIDDQFMDLPPEVLTTSMRSHQKYFSCLDKDGNLANRFVVVANMETKDGGAQITAGNERVLNARLADARFFWDQDRMKPLASRTPALKDRVFHAKLGTLDDKVDRMQALATELASFVPHADKDQVRTAARLAKTDLSTGMVAEFPDLQGVMGRYYAIHDGESMDVADAIAEHYAPQGPGDTCPTKPVSVCVALADKINTLVGFFGIGAKPTGSKDPFALRRAALGVIRLIVENEHHIPLLQTFDAAAGLYDGISGHNNASAGLLEFFADRLKVYLKEQGVRHDLIDAVFTVEKQGGGSEDDLVRLLARVEALNGFLATDDGANLLAAYKRAANILRIEEKKDGTTFDANVDASLLKQNEERALYDHLQAMKADVDAALVTENFVGAMENLAAARPLVDAFFDQVTVNADDAAVRVNRAQSIVTGSPVRGCHRKISPVLKGNWNRL